MSNEELKAVIAEYSCNCDYYGAHNCLMHNPEHPTHVIAALRAQVQKLQAEAVESAALVERLRKGLDEYGIHLDGCRVLSFNMWVNGPLPCTCGIIELLNQSPPQGFGKAVLELLATADKWYKTLAHDSTVKHYKDSFISIDAEETIAEELFQKIRALTPEYKTWLGV